MNPPAACSASPKADHRRYALSRRQLLGRGGEVGTDYAPRVGIQVVYNKQYPNGSTNQYAQLADAKQKNPDIVTNLGHLVESIVINQAAKDLRLGSKIYAYSAGPPTPDFTQALGSDANFVFRAHSGAPRSSTGLSLHLGAHLRAGVQAKVRH